jgi:hypothetical protein
MKVFISHNEANKDTARLLAIALVEQGVSVWFDEWAIRPGESIAGGIEKGLSDSDVFALVWSAAANASNWVGTEMRAYLHRRVADDTLRIIPVMIDNTPLPSLIADYKGFRLDTATRLEAVAAEITGRPADVEIARRLQNRLLELTENHASPGDPLPYIICPRCGSDELERSQPIDYEHDEAYYVIECRKCNWLEWTQ